MPEDYAALTDEQIDLLIAERVYGGYISDAIIWAKSTPARTTTCPPALTLLGWCASTGNRMLDLAVAEIERIEAKPLEEIQGSLARKADADLVVCHE